MNERSGPGHTRNTPDKITAVSDAEKEGCAKGLIANQRFYLHWDFVWSWHARKEAAPLRPTNESFPYSLLVLALTLSETVYGRSHPEGARALLRTESSIIRPLPGGSVCCARLVQRLVAKSPHPSHGKLKGCFFLSSFILFFRGIYIYCPWSFGPAPIAVGWAPVFRSFIVTAALQ